MSEISAQAVPSYLREINERRVLDVLREIGSGHAAEIARLTSLSRPTISQVLKSLTEVGLVSEQVPAQDDPRRARTMYRTVDDLGAVLSIDIGARFARAAVADLNGEIRSTVSRPMKNLSLESVLREIRAVVKDALDEAGFNVTQLLSVVVGSPGVVSPTTGQIAIAGTISELDGIALGDFISNEFHCPTIVENDVNLVTVAEAKYGAGNGVENFAVMSVGSGIGAGLHLNGSLHRGSRGAAGEIFYIPFDGTTSTDHSASDPSGNSIAMIAQKLAPQFPDSRLKEPYETPVIFDAARYKDPLALAIVEETARRIAIYVATITSVVDVDLVILAGGIGRQADVLQSEVQAVVARIVPFEPRIEVSALGEQAVLLGGIAMATEAAQDRVFAQRSLAYQSAREMSE